MLRVVYHVYTYLDCEGERGFTALRNIVYINQLPYRNTNNTIPKDPNSPPPLPQYGCPSLSTSPGRGGRHTEQDHTDIPQGLLS